MVTWSGMLVVLYVLHMLMWPWPDSRPRSRSLTFWSSANCTFLCWHHQNSLPFISALAGARSLWLWLHVGRNTPCMLAAMTVSPLAWPFWFHTKPRDWLGQRLCNNLFCVGLFPWVFWHCWLVGRNGIWPVKDLCNLSQEVLLWNRWRNKTT